MHPKFLVLLSVLTLLPGLFMASCGPAPEPEPEPSEVPAPPAPGEPVPEPLPEEPLDEAAEETPDEASAPEDAPAEEAAETAPEEAAPEEASGAADDEAEWVSLFNGEDLDGWTQRGAATWEVVDGVLTGTSEGGQGHIYAEPVLTDLEVKGQFRITDQGGGANSGLYFRATPPEDNPDGYPAGYEAQICNHHEAFTGWLWKPGNPTGEASELLTEDGEWFEMRVKAVGPKIQIWVKDQLVLTYEDDEYEKGQFAIQCHNEGMTVEAKELYYRELSGG